MSIKETYARYETLQAEIAANAGKKGNAARKQELIALQARIAYLAVKRAMIRYRSQFHPKEQRTQAAIERTRSLIAAYANATLVRGQYWALQLQVLDAAGNTINIHGSRSMPTHPELTIMHEWEAARRIVGWAIAMDLLPAEGTNFDSKQRGSAINHDIYAYVPGLVLVQVRYFNRNKYGGSVQLSYFVTDGATVIEIPNGKKSVIKRAAEADTSASSPLRKIKDVLPDNWQQLIQGDPPKLLATAAQNKGMITYKAVRKLDTGKMVSMFDRGTEYVIGRKMTKRLGNKAGQRNTSGNRIHDGGYYSHPTAERVIALQEQGHLAPQCDVPGTYVLLQCIASGRMIQFENGKIASTHLKPIAILREYEIKGGIQ